VRLGHRDILVMAVEGPESATAPGERDGVSERRLRGYEAAIHAADLSLRDDHVVAGRASIEGGAAAFQRAWGAGIRPTALLAMSDAMAIGAMRAAREQGLRIPEELSVVGFDDIDLAAHVDPPLTTVHQPIRDKGATAVRLLLAAIAAGAAHRPERVRLATELVIRASTAGRAGRAGPGPANR
jgi:DNA-binding LacI/PurR family transcriptional regulator